MFLGNQPWMQVRSFSIIKPAADVALLLTAKITGAFAAAAYSVGVTAMSNDSEPECSPPDDIVVAIGKTVGISLLSMMVGSFPVAVFGALHNPGFIHKERWDDVAREQQLRRFERSRRTPAA